MNKDYKIIKRLKNYLYMPLYFVFVLLFFLYEEIVNIKKVL